MIDLTAGRVLAAIFALGGIALAAIWFVPRGQAKSWKAQGIEDAKELAQLETGARATMVQIVGGVALILTFAATWMQIGDTRKTASDQQETERFTRAVEQLASKRPEIRVGGIYGLGRVAADSSKRRAAIAQILLAYLQQRHRTSHRNRKLSTKLRQAPSGERVCGPNVAFSGDDDMQAAVGVILSLADAARSRFKLTGLNLQNFYAQQADFRGANLSSSYLTVAHLGGARFDRAILEWTHFVWACLQGSSFARATSSSGVVFDGADLRNADFSGSRLSGSFRYVGYYPRDIKLSFRFTALGRANLSHADLSAADLRGADLLDADLRGANLSYANLRDAALLGVDLRGADLHAAKFAQPKWSWAEVRAGCRSYVNLGESLLAWGE